MSPSHTFGAPRRLRHFLDVFPHDLLEIEQLKGNERAGLDFIRTEIKRHNPNMTRYEELLADLYFAHIATYHLSGIFSRKASGSAYSAFFPIP
jgi:hypothetical protein